MVIKLLLRVGLVARRPNGSIAWPVHIAPRHCWKWPMVRGVALSHGPFYVFRNVPGVIKWVPGRMLPRRWGFGFFGLIEFGDRGH